MSLARAKESDIRRAYEAVKGAVSPRLRLENHYFQHYNFLQKMRQEHRKHF